MTSLEGWGSAIELRPRSGCALCVAYRVDRTEMTRTASDRRTRGPGLLAATRRADSRLDGIGFGMPTGCGAAWLARLLWEQEAPGSNPGIPTRS
jgi:hypothetical protein